MIQTLFTWLTRGADFLLSWIPRSLDLLALVLISILAGLAVLYIYRGISSPASIKKSKDQVKAHILAIRLYKDEWRVIVKSFILSLLATARYFAFNMIPLLILLPLLAPLFAQLEIRYGLDPVSPGRVVEIKAAFEDDLDVLEPVLVAADWYRPAMAPVYVYARQEVHWQIELLKPGHHQLKIQTRRGFVEKTLRSGEIDGRLALSSRRHRGGILDGLLYPAESPLPSAAAAMWVEVVYPGRTFPLAGLDVHWIWVHLLVVLLVVLLFKKRFGIEF
jgi:hypothetical protein